MANTKLTDTQRVVLAAAAARDSGLVLPLPTSLGNNRGTHGIVLKSLVSRGLLAERPAQEGETVWRETDDLGRITLSIAAAGLEAIGITASPETREPSSTTETGAVALPERAVSAKAAGPIAAKQGSSPRAGSKLAVLIDLLRQPTGATIPDIMEATNWQAHSVRGAISGALKKKLGLSIVSEATKDRGRVYRIGNPGVPEAEATPSSPIPTEQGHDQDAGTGEPI